jgi:Uma2 family endonuclease
MPNTDSATTGRPRTTSATSPSPPTDPGRSRRGTAHGGVEPDECWVFGEAPADRPHLAIEVVWTSGRIDRLDIYRKLGVAEVWYWRQGRIQPYCLRGERYVPVTASEVLPGLDLDLLSSFLDRPTTYEAIRGYRQALGAANDNAGLGQTGLWEPGVSG